MLVGMLFEHPATEARLLLLVEAGRLDLTAWILF